MEMEEKEQQKLDIIVFLGDFLRQAKHLWLLGLVLVLILSLGMSFFAYRSHRDYYEAHASFTVRVSNPLYSDVSSYNERTAQIMQDTFPSILTSDLLKNRVMEYLGIDSVPSLSVSATAQSSILTLKVRDPDPQKALDVLNAVIACYPQVADFVVGSTELVLLDESGLPSAPVSSFQFRSHAIRGALVGVGLWLVIVALLVFMRNTVHNEEELRKVLSTPCLGQIPTMKLTKKAPYPLIHKLRHQADFSESFRLLRLRLEKAMARDGRKVLLVSSAIPGEGKTTIAVNLALALAEKGKLVLLMDCDLRNPSVVTTLDTPEYPLNSKYGIVDVLSGSIRAGDAIQTTVVDNLHIISGGPGQKSDKAVMLSQERMELLIQAAREQYDYVILDTPPCSMLSDASELAELAECGLLVIRQDYASREQILDGVQHLADSKLPLVGCMLNNVRKGFTGSYGYGSGYGYGYGYGQENNR